MEYKGKMMEKEGQIPKNTLKNLPARSARRFITLKKSPARFARRGKKLFLREGGKNDFFGIYIPLEEH